MYHGGGHDWKDSIPFEQTLEGKSGEVLINSHMQSGGGKSFQSMAILKRSFEELVTCHRIKHSLSSI